MVGVETIPILRLKKFDVRLFPNPIISPSVVASEYLSTSSQSNNLTGLDEADDGEFEPIKSKLPPLKLLL